MEQHELRALEEQCIQDCAPTCQASCPIHVDARAMADAIGRGDFSSAFATFKRTCPFPGIISHICDSPCQSACLRAKAGGSIAINALERACLAYGEPPPDKPRPLPKRSQRVAVVGGGVSGMTAAYDLARKGYHVVIFEAGDVLGGDLWKIPRDELPEEVLRSDLAVVTDRGVEVRYGTPVNRLGMNGNSPRLLTLRSEFDAVYLAIGAHTDDRFELACDAQGRIQVDAVTFATSLEGVFAGGGLLWGSDFRSAVESISEGRRAGISMDRYLQHVSLTASRREEGAYTTRLFTNMQGIASEPMIETDDAREGYEPEEAVKEAQRCLQCECLECVKVCEYLRSFGRYPRKYLREIYNNLSIVKGTRHANRFINSCSLCGLCAEVCPEHLDMAAVIRQSRREMVKQDRMPASAHDFALRDMAFSNGANFALARHAPGTTSSDYLFFPGCQLAASSPDLVERVYADLRTFDPRIGLMLGCCGAPAEWAGRDDLLQATLSSWQAQHRALGQPPVIVACSSCHQVLSRAFPEASLVSLWEILERLPVAERLAQGERRPVAIHDPCTTRGQPSVQASARRLVERLGYSISELPLAGAKTECCSYGGMMWLANPEMAHAVVDRRNAASDLDYVTYCAMCRDFLAARGKPARHLLDLVYGARDDWNVRHGPGWSERHANRAALKRTLLGKLWGEGMDERAEHEAVRLEMAQDVRERLEERLVLVEDIQRVIAYAEKTGNKFRKRDNGHWLAAFRPTAVTYWVEYSQRGDSFVIHNAYSHRMAVAEDKRT